jgi:hypothetical protein
VREGWLFAVSFPLQPHNALSNYNAADTSDMHKLCG